MLTYGFALVYGAKRLEADDRRGGSSNIVSWCALQCGSAALALGLVAAVNGDWMRLAAQMRAVDPGRWFGVVLAAGISAMTLPLFYRVLEVAGPIPTAALQWLITLTGALEATIFLPVTWVWENWAGLAMTLGALWWVLRQERVSGKTLLAR
jgi:hypothetical protein